MTRSRPLADFLTCLFGPAVWAAHFFVVYATEALACTPATAAPRQAMLVITIATIVALAALAAFLAWQFRGKPRADDESIFLRRISVGLALLAMLAVAWSGLPPALLPACLPPAG
jgi:hypothetical protein